MRAARSGESALLLLDVLDVLAQLKIKYAVIGALAASVYGAVRASMDADLLLAVNLPQARSLSAQLIAAGFATTFVLGKLDDPIAALIKVSDDFGNRVDLLVGLKGADPAAFSRLNEIACQGHQIQFVGREDFIAMNAFAGGPLDLADASRAVIAAGPQLDLIL